MFTKRIFLARNEKKYQHRTLKIAQSSLEYALILPLLIFIILSILEFAFIWQKTNSLEMSTQEISANIATNASITDNDKSYINELIKAKTAYLQKTDLSFRIDEQNQSIAFISNEKRNNKPILSLIITYNQLGPNLVTVPTVQAILVHQFIFFPKTIMLKSSKTITNNNY